MLGACIRFVESFCRGSEKNQQLMSPHVGLVLTYAGKGLAATRAVSAIYANNLKLCRVMEEASIARIVEILVGEERAGAGVVTGVMLGAQVRQLRKEDRRKPHYLHFLRRLCSVDGTAVLQNHHYALKQMSQKGPLKLTQPRELKHIIATDAEAQERALLLFRGETGEKMRQQLVYEAGGLADLAPKVDVVVDALNNPAQGGGNATADASVGQGHAKNKSVGMMA